MPRSRRPSAQTLNVLAALVEEPTSWRYGYDLARTVGLKSGSLYPILMRLCDRDLLAAKWEESPPLGRPARHLYRLTASGRAYAVEHGARSVTRPAKAGRAELQGAS